MGAGQYSLDRKGDSQETRFYQSKGVDVFSWPLQATLLPATHAYYTSSSSSLRMSRCGDNVVVVEGTTVHYFVSGTWTAISMPLSGPSVVYDITTNDTVVYLATDTGIYYATPGTVNTFALYAANDLNAPYSTAGYQMISWANDQLLAASLGRLYAFQPRTSTSYPFFGNVPSVGDVSAPIQTVTANATVGSTGVATVVTKTPHNLAPGQPITIDNSSTYMLSPLVTVTSITDATVTLSFTYADNPFSIGDVINVKYNIETSSGHYTPVTDSNVTVTNASAVSLSYANSTIPSADWRYLVNGGTYYGSTVDVLQNAGNSSPFNAKFLVNTVISNTVFTIYNTDTSLIPANYQVGLGGTVTSSIPPDVLVTHDNPNWVWSTATGGPTQVYFGGYVKSPLGNKGSGCIYRSDMLGASTTSSSGIQTITATSVTQPWNLDVPVQALPMSPDEYPTVLRSYLNFIFIGTNRGVRMAQTLSVYDPSATASGDLKSGPLIPNILQPINTPVTGIVGDGRYVWFTWNNYDSVSTGLGRLDLGTFINGDPLAPAYASDIMVTGQGIINSLDWDPITNTPIMAVAGLGIYGPYATNMGSGISVSQYVSSGTITSGIFDYGIADPKIPVYVQYNAETPSGTSVLPSVVLEPGTTGSTTPTLTVDTKTPSTYDFPNVRANQFQTTITLSTTNTANTPKLHRWVVKSWPGVVQGTEISVVVQLFSVAVVDGLEIYQDPYAEFYWLEQRRQNADIITYTEGPLSSTAVIDSLDWIPHKRRDNFENGYEGDLVISMKTIGQYSYNPPSTT